MARIQLLADADLPADKVAQIQAIEARGADASVLRAVAHRADMFDAYFSFYYPAHEGGMVEPELKELVRLKIARLNDCFT
jgi:alkylhydroperoxidase family enzyme